MLPGCTPSSGGLTLARAAVGAVLGVAAGRSFLTSHVYRPRGVVTTLVLAVALGLLASVTAPGPAPRR